MYPSYFLLWTQHIFISLHKLSFLYSSCWRTWLVSLNYLSSCYSSHQMATEKTQREKPTALLAPCSPDSYVASCHLALPFCSVSMAVLCLLSPRLSSCCLSGTPINQLHAEASPFISNLPATVPSPSRGTCGLSPSSTYKRAFGLLPNAEITCM